MAGTPDRARFPVLGYGWQRGVSAGSAVRAGAGYATAGNLRRRTRYPAGSDRREPHARNGGRVVLGDLAGRGGPGAGVLADGPRGALDFFLLVPLDLLAAVTVADLVNRRVPVRTLIVLAPATAMTVAWWASEDLQGAVDDLMHGRADAATALGLHLVLDLILLSIWFTRRLDHWARRRDDRQRRVLAFFLLTILAITVGTGVQEVVFRHSETHDLLTLRTMILRRNRERPFEQLAVVGPEVVTAPPHSTPHPGGAQASSTPEAGCGSSSAPRSHTCRNAT